MKSILNISSCILILLFTTSCASFTTTKTTYADDGKTVVSVEVIESKGNPFMILAQNSSAKNWVIHQGGWGFNIGYEGWGIQGGTVDNTMASFTDDGADIATVSPAIIDSGKYYLTISKDGVISKTQLTNTPASNK